MSGRPAQRAIAAVVYLTATLSSPVSAEDAQGLAVDVVGKCPDPELVARELAPLLGGYSLTSNEPALVASVEDRGESYQIRVAGAMRDVDDPKRACLDRARVAAVFLALNLPPPTPKAHRESSAAASQQPPREMPPTRAAEPTWAAERALALRIFATAESAWGAQATATGAGLGVSLRRGAFSVSLVGAGTTSTAPYQASEPAPRFELTRAPLALLLGWHPGSTSVLSWGIEAGPALDLLSFQGKAVPHPAGELRLNPGMRVSAAVRVRASGRLAAELSPTVAWFPRTYLVRVAPSRTLGETPPVWAGLSLGFRYEIWTD